MPGARRIFVMLEEVIEGTNLGVVVKAGGGQDRDVDAGEFLPVGDHALPVGVIARMVEPAVEERIGRAVDLVQRAVGRTFDIPLAVHSPPASPIVVGPVVESLVRRRVERPVVDEALEYIAFHRHVDAGRRRHRRHQRLQRLRHVLGRGPLGKTFVAPPEHADPAVAPRLTADPVDHRRRVRAVLLIGDGRVGAAPLAAREALDAGIAVRRRPPGFVERRLGIGVDREVEQRRQTARDRARANHQGADRRAIRGFDRDVLVDDVTPAVVLVDQGRRERRDAPKGLLVLISANQGHRVGERDAALALPRLQRLVQVLLDRGQVDPERADHQGRGPVVQPAEGLAERTLKRLVERRSVPALPGPGLGENSVQNLGRPGLGRPDLRRHAARRQRAQRRQGLARLRVLAGDDLQSKHIVEKPVAIVIPVDPAHLPGQSGHRPRERRGILGRRARKVERLRRARRGHQTEAGKGKPLEH